MVVISSSACMTAKERHEFTRCPLTCTVQAPHCPWSQPFLVPGRFRFSRRQSSRVVRGSRLSVCCRPFTLRATGILPAGVGAAGVWGVDVCEVATEPRTGEAVTAMPAAPRWDRKDRRVTRFGGSASGSDFSTSPRSGSSGGLGSLAKMTPHRGYVRRSPISFILGSRSYKRKGNACTTSCPCTPEHFYRLAVLSADMGLARRAALFRSSLRRWSLYVLLTRRAVPFRSVTQQSRLGSEEMFAIRLTRTMAPRWIRINAPASSRLLSTLSDSRIR